MCRLCSCFCDFRFHFGIVQTLELFRHSFYGILYRTSIGNLLCPTFLLLYAVSFKKWKFCWQETKVNDCQWLVRLFDKAEFSDQILNHEFCDIIGTEKKQYELIYWKSLKYVIEYSRIWMRGWFIDWLVFIANYKTGYVQNLISLVNIFWFAFDKIII